MRGRVVFAGSLENLLKDQRSLTSKYLRGDLAIPVPSVRTRPSATTAWIERTGSAPAGS